MTMVTGDDDHRAVECTEFAQAGKRSPHLPYDEVQLVGGSRKAPWKRLSFASICLVEERDMRQHAVDDQDIVGYWTDCHPGAPAAPRRKRITLHLVHRVQPARFEEWKASKPIARCQQ